MLESSVLHLSRGGPRGDGDVVGISWKAPTRSHPSPSLVVTCPHQVVVYKPGEERRTHQWSFKPSAATVLSHAAVFLAAGSRYVGVQQGSTLVSWRGSEQDVKRPLSAQATGPVQAVHACPQLRDHFVVVLTSGGVALYQGGLRRVAHCDAAGGGDDGGGSAADARARAVWSGVRGNRVVVLENIGAATDRVTTFSLAVEGGPEPPPSLSSSSSRRQTAASGVAGAAFRGGGAATTATASVTLVSSHVLPKPTRVSRGSSCGEGAAAAAAGEEEVRASACSAAFLGREAAGGGAGGSAGGRSVVAVAWRTSRGPMWTKVVIGAGGATEEFARPDGSAAVTCHGVSDDSSVNGNGVVSSNGHGTKSRKSKGKTSAAAGDQPLASISRDGSSAVAGWGSVPTVAAADGGRLIVHSGGGGGDGACPRLAIWDAAYGVLLEDGAAPGVSTEDSGGGGGGGGAPPSPGRRTRVVGMKVSGDGAHLALAVAGRVLICPVPVKAAGTLASLLRRKRPSPGGTESAGLTAGTGGGGGGGGPPAFPSVDLIRSAAAWKLFERSGPLEAEEWEAAVLKPFREAEAEAVRSLCDAARRNDGGAFERVLRQHLQQQQCAAAAAGVRVLPGRDEAGAGVVVGGEDGSKKRGRIGSGRDGAWGDCSSRVFAAAIELCLANPGANLWGALALLVRSGRVSARHHRGLVTAIVEHASPELLEEVMLHVPDLPEVDAVRILQHFLSQAATIAKEPNEATSAASAAAAMLMPEIPNEASGGAPPAKRARGGGYGGVAAVAGGPPLSAADSAWGDGSGGGGVVVSVLKSPSKNGAKSKKKGGGGGSGEMVKSKGGRKTVTMDESDDDDDDEDDGDDAVRDAATVSNGVAATTPKTNTGPSNGHSAAGYDDGGTSSDGGVSDGGTQAETGRAGKRAEKAATAAGAAARAAAATASVNKRVITWTDRRATALATAKAAARAERAVRVAMTLPHNEAFLRSALAGLSHGEVLVVLKVLTRLLAEGKSLKATSAGAKTRGKIAAIAASGLPPARTESVLGWACALLDSHFTRLAVGGAADSNLAGALQALKRATRGEAQCCELLVEVRSLVDEVGRRHAAAAAAARRRPSLSSSACSPQDLFTLRVMTF